MQRSTHPNTPKWAAKRPPFRWSASCALVLLLAVGGAVVARASVPESQFRAVVRAPGHGHRAALDVRGSRLRSGDFNAETFLPRVPCSGKYHLGMTTVFVPRGRYVRFDYRARVRRLRLSGPMRRCGRR